MKLKILEFPEWWGVLVKNPFHAEGMIVYFLELQNDRKQAVYSVFHVTSKYQLITVKEKYISNLL